MLTFSLSRGSEVKYRSVSCNFMCFIFYLRARRFSVYSSETASLLNTVQTLGQSRLNDVTQCTFSCIFLRSTFYLRTRWLSVYSKESLLLLSTEEVKSYSVRLAAFFVCVFCILFSCELVLSIFHRNIVIIKHFANPPQQRE